MDDWTEGETLNMRDLPENVARAILGDAVVDELVRQAAEPPNLGTYTVTAIEPDEQTIVLDDDDQEQR
jgi:hypothetical protein